MAGPDVGDGSEKKGKKKANENDAPVGERAEEGHDDYPEEAFGPGGLPEN